MFLSKAVMPKEHQNCWELCDEEETLNLYIKFVRISLFFLHSSSSSSSYSIGMKIYKKYTHCCLFSLISFSLKKNELRTEKENSKKTLSCWNAMLFFNFFFSSKLRHSYGLLITIIILITYIFNSYFHFSLSGFFFVSFFQS